MKIFYFTTTGNSLAVARAIGGELFSLVGVLSSGVGEWCDDEAIGVVCPVYFGALPRPVREFLDMAVLRAPYRFLVLTCGNTPAFAVNDRMVGWDYIASVRMVDNYFPMFDVAKQVRELPAKHVEDRVNRICSDIAGRRVYREPVTMFGRIAGWYMGLFPLSKNAYRNFYIDGAKCTSCGLCEKLCPVSNIVMNDGRPVIGEMCMTCGACYHNCPSAAIRYKGEKSRMQYRHAAVSPGDIIAAERRSGLG